VTPNPGKVKLGATFNFGARPRFGDRRGGYGMPAVRAEDLGEAPSSVSLLGPVFVFIRSDAGVKPSAPCERCGRMRVVDFGSRRGCLRCGRTR
jgi:hypothetical protein